MFCPNWENSLAVESSGEEAEKQNKPRLFLLTGFPVKTTK